MFNQGVPNQKWQAPEKREMEQRESREVSAKHATIKAQQESTTEHWSRKRQQRAEECKGDAAYLNTLSLNLELRSSNPAHFTTINW